MGELNDYFRRRRLELRLRLPQVASTVGYVNLRKGCNRIGIFEREGRIHSDLLGKLAIALGISPEQVDDLVERDRRRFFNEWNAWANEPVRPYAVIRLIPAVYKREWLPESITTPEEAEHWAAEIARQWHRRVCLIWTRRTSVWFDEDGIVYSRTEATPDWTNEPHMRQRGNKRGFTLGTHSIHLIRYPLESRSKPARREQE